MPHTLRNSRVVLPRDAAVMMTVKMMFERGGLSEENIAQTLQLDVDKVKIDKSFVHDIVTNGESEAIVHAVTYLARVLGIPVTAEGVETKIQHDLLGIIGCSEMQGYFYSHPLSAEDTQRFLDDKSKWTRIA